MTKNPPGLSVRSEDDFLHDQAQSMRAGVYELLGRLFVRAPDQALLDTLRDIGDVDVSDGPIAMGWELLKQASVKADVTSVDEEFFSLFIGVGRGELVPFGSWYITGFLMEKPLAVLRTDLAELGIERQEGVRESEDHFAGLCDAMALLIRSGDDVPFERQQVFFNDHIAPWASRFLKDVQDARHARFYRSVGFFADSVINFESELLAMRT